MIFSRVLLEFSKKKFIFPKFFGFLKTGLGLFVTTSGPTSSAPAMLGPCLPGGRSCLAWRIDLDPNQLGQTWF